jgi:hypothetical protein
MAVLITENFAQHRDISREAAFLGKGIVPDSAQQFVLLEGIPGVATMYRQSKR